MPNQTPIREKENRVLSPPETETMGHPDPAKLAAYRDGQLSPDDEGSFRDHLMECEDCVDLLLMGAGSPAPEDPKVADFEKEVTWRALRAELRADQAQQEAAAARARIEVQRRRSGYERWGLVAAALVVVLPLGGLSLRQQTVITEVTRPQINVAIYDVDAPRIVLRGEAPPQTTFEVPRGTDFYTLVLPIEARDYDLYRVDLVGSEDRAVWSGKASSSTASVPPPWGFRAASWRPETTRSGSSAGGVGRAGRTAARIRSRFVTCSHGSCSMSGQK